jgi:enoyl-CoA hydratase/carnithine racemase
MLILRERRGHTETLTLNRPEAGNSLNPGLMDELGVALQDILDDVDARAVVLTGAGDRIFCAGMDLSALGDWNDAGSGPGDRPGARALADFMAGNYPKPLIAAVNGAAVGGGLELVMACDLVVAADKARFGLPEVKRGLYAAGGGTVLATRIPQALALELGLTGRLIDAGRAERFGLVNQVVTAAALMETAIGLADEVAANGPLAVQLTKRLMRAAVSSGHAAGLATPEESASIFRSEDAREGAAAFMEKRSAVFVGR